MRFPVTEEIVSSNLIKCAKFVLDTNVKSEKYNWLTKSAIKVRKP